MRCSKRVDYVWDKKAAGKVERQVLIDALRGASRWGKFKAWCAFYWIRLRRKFKR